MGISNERKKRNAARIMNQSQKENLKPIENMEKNVLENQKRKGEEENDSRNASIRKKAKQASQLDNTKNPNDSTKPHEQRFMDSVAQKGKDEGKVYFNSRDNNKMKNILKEDKNESNSVEINECFKYRDWGSKIK